MSGASSYGGIISSSDFNNITSNSIAVTSSGIYVLNSLVNNISSNSINLSSGTYAILQENSNYTTISTNYVKARGSSALISLTSTGGFSQYNKVLNNVFNRSAGVGINYAISLQSMNLTLISSNSIEGADFNFRGISISDSVFTNATNNIINMSGQLGHGILLDTSNDSLISTNKITVSGSAAYGMYLLDQANNNTLMNNNLSSGQDYEIFDDSGLTFENYLVYNNSFGSIRWTNTSFLWNLTIDGIIGMGPELNISIGNNTASVNASAFSQTRINSTANITLAYVPDFNAVRKLFTFTTSESEIRTNGVDCIADGTCTELQYLNDQYTFNTSAFSSFAGDSVTALACTWSNDALNVTFGYGSSPSLSQGAVYNASKNFEGYIGAGTQTAGVNWTTYNITADSTNTVAVNITISGSHMQAGANILGIGNITWMTNETNGNGTDASGQHNFTYMGENNFEGFNLSLIADGDPKLALRNRNFSNNLAIGSTAWYRFWLRVPENQIQGTYVGNYTMTCAAAS